MVGRDWGYGLAVPLLHNGRFRHVAKEYVLRPLDFDREI